MKRAYVTYMTTEDYLPGVLALYRSLRLFKNRHDFVILTTRSLPDHTAAVLESVGCTLRLTEEIINPHIGKEEQAFNHYTKLRIFELTEYDKIIFIDADMIICSNLEHLFKAPHMSAVVAGGLIAENNWTDLNGGFMVVEPSQHLFDEMLSATPYLPSSDRSDQGFLQSFYKDWKQEPELHLDHKYNVPVLYLDTYCTSFRYEFSYTEQELQTNISVLHYWGPVKPWQIDRQMPANGESQRIREAVDLWWDFYLAMLMDIDENKSKLYSPS